ncbi:MAG: SCO family protein [Methyloligellaceae bacterium]
MRLRLILVILAAFSVGAFAAVAALTYDRSSGGAGVVQGTGKPLVGGPFALTDHTGKRVTEKDFRGRHMLVYFGFTYCPDVCPAELQVMTSALDALGDAGTQVTPVFITVDPERDTVKQLADYVKHFHKSLIGLTGTADEIRAAAKAYRVYFAKVKDESSSAGYTFDHSSIVFLMDPKGEYAAHFSTGTGPEKMAAGIRKHL